MLRSIRPFFWTKLMFEIIVVQWIEFVAVLSCLFSCSLLHHELQQIPTFLEQCTRVILHCDTICLPSTVILHFTFRRSIRFENALLFLEESLHFVKDSHGSCFAMLFLFDHFMAKPDLIMSHRCCLYCDMPSPSHHITFSDWKPITKLQSGNMYPFRCIHGRWFKETIGSYNRCLQWSGSWWSWNFNPFCFLLRQIGRVHERDLRIERGIHIHMVVLLCKIIPFGIVDDRYLLFLCHE